MSCQILHLLFINVIKHRVNRQIAPVSILRWRANLHGRHSWVLWVLFIAQIYKVYHLAFDTDRRRLQVLWKLIVCFYYSIVLFILMLVWFCGFLSIDSIIDKFCKLLPIHVVEGDIDVITILAKELQEKKLLWERWSAIRNKLTLSRTQPPATLSVVVSWFSCTILSNVLNTFYS